MIDFEVFQVEVLDLLQRLTPAQANVVVAVLKKLLRRAAQSKNLDASTASAITGVILYHSIRSKSVVPQKPSQMNLRLMRSKYSSRELTNRTVNHTVTNSVEKATADSRGKQIPHSNNIVQSKQKKATVVR